MITSDFWTILFLGVAVAAFIPVYRKVIVPLAVRRAKMIGVTGAAKTIRDVLPQHVKDVAREDFRRYCRTSADKLDLAALPQQMQIGGLVDGEFWGPENTNKGYDGSENSSRIG